MSPPSANVPIRPPLLRPVAGRRLAGVCQGVAAHLELKVRTVRLITIALSLVGGIGVMLYVWLWVTVPAGDPLKAAAEASAPLPKLAASLSQRWRRFPVTDVAVGLVLLGAAAMLLATAMGWQLDLTVIVPVVVVAGGIVLAWSQLESSDARARAGRTPVSVLRILAAAALVIVGVLALITQGRDAATMVQAALAALAVVAGLALALAPWWLRLLRALGDERAEAARQTERADIAAHLHDSVLQTLVLIRSRAQDADEVQRLARYQERELRAWLYSDRGTTETSLAEQLRADAGQVEDTYGVEVSLVVVGDIRPDERTEAIERATSEAMTNAVRHGKPPFSVYAEVRDDVIEVFIRDRGDGFDLEEIAPDRYGVRESIVGRMERAGGSADVVAGAGNGTEVRLKLPLNGGES